jgi:hypothetical protein
MSVNQQTPPRDPRVLTPLQFAGIKQFLDQSQHASTPELLVVNDPPPCIASWAVERPTGLPPAILLGIEHKGELLKCRLDPSSFAVVLLLIGLGDTLKCNDNGKRRVYLKVGLRADKNAGITVQRLICASEAGEAVRFVSTDTLDLRFPNLREGLAGAKRGMVEVLVQGLSRFSNDAPEDLFGGTVEARFAHYKGLLSRALERLQWERETYMAA